MGGRYPEMPSVAVPKPDTLPRVVYDYARISAPGLTQNGSSVFFTPAYDIYNKTVHVRCVADFTLTADTTGKSITAPTAGEHHTTFELDIQGLVKPGQYVFPDHVSVTASYDRKSHEGPPRVGLTRRNTDAGWYRTDGMNLNVASRNAASVFDLQIRIEFFVSNVDFGHGILFPDYA